MKKESIILNYVESYPTKTNEIIHGGKVYYSPSFTGIKVNFTYKAMNADIILLYKDFKTDNPSNEEIKDKIIEVINE